MQLQLPVLFTLLGSAAAFPSSTDKTTSTAPEFNGTDAPILEKRWKHGWIGSFTSNDCHGDNIGPRPKLMNTGDCEKFTSPREANHIGINFGTARLGFDVVTFYTDDDCKNIAKKSTTGGYYHQRDGKDGYGCTKEFRDVRSVKATIVGDY